jgi:hypothetical protein
MIEDSYTQLVALTGMTQGDYEEQELILNEMEKKE